MKLTIYVPDDRSEDIERLRNADCNFSQLFIQAIDRELVTRAHISNVKDKSMKQVIERLKRGASESNDAGRNDGFKCGVEAAKDDLDIRGIKAILDAEEGTVREILQSGYDAIFSDDYFDAVDQSAADESDPEGYLRGWDIGFRDGVRDVWEKIREAFE